MISFSRATSWFSPIDSAQVRDTWVIGRPLSSAQALICACAALQVLLRGARAAHRHARIAQAQQHVARQHEGVPAEEAQQVLAAEAAQPRAALAEHVQQPDLVVGRPVGQELAEAAVLGRDLAHELRVVAHRPDLLRVAHDALVRCELLPELGGLEQQPLGIELEERLLEARPFLVDDVPHEAGREDAAPPSPTARGRRPAWPAPCCRASSAAGSPAPSRRPCARRRARGCA